MENIYTFNIIFRKILKTKKKGKGLIKIKKCYKFEKN